MQEHYIEATTNASDFSAAVQILGDDGSPFGLYGNGWTVTINMAPANPIGAAGYGDGYSSRLARSPKLTASTTDGTAAIQTDDTIEWTWRASQMHTLPAGEYAIQALATKDNDTVNLFEAVLPVKQGIW